MEKTGSLSEYLPPKYGEIFHADASCFANAFSFLDFFFFFFFSGFTKACDCSSVTGAATTPFVAGISPLV